MTKLNEAEVLDFLDVGVNTSETTHPGDPIGKARIRVTLDQLRPYDRNPRQSRNPKFDSILASIEARGLDHPPNISRRNPGDKYYLIIDGGNTRLEILNILYDKYKKLAKTAKTDEERQTLLEKAQSFHVIDCTFKPWKSESSTLTGHMAENEERGDTLFIEKALAVQTLRQIYEEEDRLKAEAQSKELKDKPLTIRALAERITTQGWTVSHSHISRFEYAAHQLLPVVPTALWAGAGGPLIKALRRLEKAYSTFWASTDMGRDNPQHLLDLFFKTLTEFDDVSIDIDGFSRALDCTLADTLSLPVQTISAEIQAVMAGIKTAPTVSSPTLTMPTTTSPESAVKNSSPGKKDESTRTPSKPSTKKAGADSSPHDHDSPETLQESIISTALKLAVRYGLMIDRTDRSKASNGCDWFIVHPLKAMDAPPGNSDHRAAVWWALFRLSRTYRQIPNVHNIFIDTFSQYLVDDTSVTDVTLLLYEYEDDLPEEDQEYLQTIQALIQQGSELTGVRQKSHQGDE
ncbi:MAG: ParB N-terminal domain-containing protein [Gammaproteobacteria bacterium]|nr:ParB N-terminal domain-containing protein [Gammaproteobacteria bacterium]